MTELVDTRPVAGPAAVEAVLGDATDPDNPFGHAAVAMHDDAGRLAPGLPEALTVAGLGAALVPEAHGGRLRGLDGLVRALRSVGRRDPAAALALGVTPFMAWANVWVGGDAGQRDAVGRLLVAGQRVACAYHELDHGNDLTANALTARRDGGGWVLTGRKEVISNADSCAAAVVFARTEDRPGPRSHSLFLLDAAVLGDPRARTLPRYRTAGMRGVRLTGLDLDGCPVPGDAVLGTPGRATQTALRCFQLSRVVLPGATVGLLDTMLRLAVTALRDRSLYGGTALDLPATREVLAAAFLDLLVADAHVRAVARAASVAPEHLGPLAAGVKSLVPEVLVGAVDRLAVLLGSQFFLRDGSGATVQKLVRDARPTSFGHASQVTCLVSLLPHLLRCAGSRGPGAATPAALFDVDDVGPVDVSRLRVAAPAGDLLAARAAGEPAAGWDVRVAALAADALARGVADTRVDASTAALDAAHAWTCAQAAGACLGLSDAGRTPLADPLVRAAALTRLALLARRHEAPLSRAAREHLLDLLLARVEGRLTLDLDPAPTPA